MKHIGSVIFKAAVICAAALTFGALLFLAGYILIRGVPNLRWELFSPNYSSENASMLPSVINTLLITVTALAIALPLGIFSAVYLAEYAKRGNIAVSFIRITAQTLSGIPSIVYGLFGLLFFVTYLKWGYSLLAGAATLAIMVLPLIMRTTEEALISVPDSYREASYGVGAGRERTVFRIVLPSAMSGILSGVILSVGRIMGETAALIYTAGTASSIANSLFSSGRTLSVHMYILSSEGLYTNQAYATASVLLAVAVIINVLSTLAAERLSIGHKPYQRKIKNK
jgi:phosphate transport system permease protein